jgi:hypothetical protein
MGLKLAAKDFPALGKHAEMFDPPNYSDYDRWLDVFFEASVRLDALETAVTDVRHLLRHGASVYSHEIVKVLDQHGV